jgi:hypothetical protein
MHHLQDTRPHEQVSALLATYALPVSCVCR